MIKQTLLATTLLTLASTASFAEGNWFVGGGVGQSSNRDYECIGCGAPIGTLDDSGSASKVFGGYRFNRNIAVLGGYTDLADTDATGTGAAWTDKLEVHGFYVAAQAILPVNDYFDVFATVGFFRWDQTVTFNGASGSFNGTDPMFGVGASYYFMNSGVKAQFEWNRFLEVGTNDPFFGHLDDYDLFSLNLVLEF
jgi:OOP family OmpA-OmpF porin